MSRQVRKGVLLVLAGTASLLLVVFLWMLFSSNPMARENPQVAGHGPRYGTWGDDVELELADLPTAEEFKRRTDELFSVKSIPIVNLKSDGEVTEHGVYKKMNMTISDGANPENNYNGLSGKMKPRGNSTYKIGLQYGPVPYKIKLDEAVDLLGMGKSKKWCLIANFIDRSYTKQFVIYQTSQLMMGEEYFQPKAKYVEVHLNGEYKGLYLLTESIEEDEGRLGLEVDLDEYGSDIPFLLEMEYRGYICEERYKHLIMEEFSSFRFFADSYEKVPTWLLDDDKENDDCSYTPYDLKYPEDFDEMSDAQEEHVRHVMRDLYEAAKLGVPIGDLGIDVNSFVNYYLSMELVVNPTFAGPSVYMYKAPDTNKMTMGPLWDFDTAMFGAAAGSVELEKNTLYEYLYKFKSFRKALISRYGEFEERLFPAIEESIAALRNNQVLKKAVLKAEAKYHTWTRSLNGHNGFPGPTYDIPDATILSLKSFEAHVDHISGWLFDGFLGADGHEYEGRTSWMRNELIAEWGK